MLAIEVAEDATVGVGALGERTFARGTYAYVGSAFGPGGFSRVDRHRELARGERDARHWHVDYLLGATEATLAHVVLFPDEDRECDLAATLPGDPVDGVGASDCDCEAHLLAAPGTEALVAAATGRGGRIEPPERRTDRRGCR